MIGVLRYILARFQTDRALGQFWDEAKHVREPVRVVL
jgi:hypothetical protein